VFWGVLAVNHGGRNQVGTKGGVVIGPLKPVLAIRGTKQAVPALAMEGVSALQTRNPRRDLFASELGVQLRMMTVQPQGKSFA
jgi:hypothetical protein